MRRRFCPNRIFWGSNFSNSLHLSQILFKTGKQCAFHENCTKRSFQVMRSTFWPNRIFWGSNFSQSLHLFQILFKTCEKLYKTLVAQHVLANAKLSHWPEILFKTGKQCAFHEHCTKRSFQVMQHVLAKSHFWASKLSKSSHWPKFSPKRENSALFMKIVQNALFRSCAARFGQIAF